MSVCAARSLSKSARDLLYSSSDGRAIQAVYTWHDKREKGALPLQVRDTEPSCTSEPRLRISGDVASCLAVCTASAGRTILEDEPLFDSTFCANTSIGRD